MVAAGVRDDRHRKGLLMSTSNFEELLRSPLDDDGADRDRASWLPVGIGALIGVIVGSALAFALGDPTEQTATTTTALAEADPEVVTVVADPAPFPDGYTPITTNVAVRAEEPVTDTDRTLVPLTMVVQRGVDPAEATRPLGGRWEVSTGNTIVSSVRTVFDAGQPSLFSVEFPALASPPVAMRLVERWDPRPAESRITIPWSGLPFDAREPITLDLAAGVSVTLTKVDLGNFLGRIEWELVGGELAIVDVEVALFLEDGSLLGEYGAGPVDLDPEPGQGFIDYFWAPGFSVEQDEATTMTLLVRASLGERVPIDIEIPVPG